MTDVFKEYLEQFDLSLISSAETQLGMEKVNEQGKHRHLQALISQAELFPLMFFIIDSSAGMVYANQAFLDYIGMPLEQLGKQQWLGHVHPEDQPATYKKLIVSIKGKKPYFIENRFKGSDGVYRSYVTVCSPRILEDGTLYYLGIIQDVTDGLTEHTSGEEAKLKQLSTREIEVLQSIALGYTNQQIAEKLFISEITVKNHIGKIFKKLTVTNRTQAAFFAQKVKLV